MANLNFRANPGKRHFPITPSDTTVLDCHALWVTAAGNLVVEDSSGTAVTYAVGVGLFPFGATKVRAATTATVIGWR